MAETDRRKNLKLDPEVYGRRDHRFRNTVHHYRGIPYATVSERFAKPKLATNWRENGRNFTEYGAQCPQPAFPVEALMMLPSSSDGGATPIHYDEFECCNLNVTSPAKTSESPLPVYVWIHGGGQSVSFPSAQHRLGDSGPLVAQSIDMGKPIILVTVNYRLNIFGFSDPEGKNMNLDLQDQEMAFRWVQEYIDSFGGDPQNITIGGQSAGAIYVHGLLAMNIKPKRAILASGSLYLTAPQDRRRGLKLLHFIEQALRSRSTHNSAANDWASGELLRKAPVQDLVKIFQESKFYSWWMFEDLLGDWKDDVRVFSHVDAVLLSDCRDEGVPYDQRLRQSTKEELLAAFQSLSEVERAALFDAYDFNAEQDDREKCNTMARDFVNDARYALWTREIWDRIKTINGKAYLCQYDEVNPFGPWPHLGRPVAHHAVDLLAAFGGYDDVVNGATKEAGRVLRGKWIDFINGEEPWAPDMIYCIGPDGKNGPVPAEEPSSNKTAVRRRTANFPILKQIGIDALTRVWQQLLPTDGVDDEV